MHDLEKTMKSSFFIDRKLRKKISKDIKKRERIEDKINQLQKQLNDIGEDISDDLDEFYEQADDETILSVLKYYEENSGQKKVVMATDLEERYRGRNLFIEDTLNLTDWYEKMCSNHNNKI